MPIAASFLGAWAASGSKLSFRGASKMSLGLTVGLIGGLTEMPDAVGTVFGTVLGATVARVLCDESVYLASSASLVSLPPRRSKAWAMQAARASSSRSA